MHKLVLVDSESTDTVLKGAHGFLCLFDVSNRASFNELQVRALAVRGVSHSPSSRRGCWA